MLHHLYNALTAEHGIVLQAEGDGEALRQALYRERKAANDPALDALSVSISPTDPSQVWVYKKVKPNGSAKE
jgi:hypothetical protein